MPKPASEQPISKVRRADRAVTDDGWIRDFLQRAPMGAFATISGDQPFINSNIFVFDAAAHAIYFHTAKTGRTRSNVQENRQVCFSVSEMGRLLPAEEALHFSVEYRGVVVFGNLQIIDDESEAANALQLLLDKYFPHLKPGTDYRPVVAEELKRTTVYRLDIREWSGKQKQVEADFPGAFRYESLPEMIAKPVTNGANHDV